MSLLRSAARRLGLGKFRYWKGSDLEGNNFYERPHPEYPDEWRKNKRYIEYRVVKPLSDYGYDTLPVQWSAWLRRTRREPPSLAELEADYARQLRLRENVARLEDAYREEKLRMQAGADAARLAGPGSGMEAAMGGTHARRGTGERQRAAEQEQPPQEGLPAKDGGAGAAAGRRAPEIARGLDAGSETVRGAGAQEEGPEAAAKRRRDEEHAAALRRREEFAKQNPAPLQGNPGDSHQPQGWSPTAPARRR
ncbi:hypothetical protein JCM10450v2_004044 [Rhodotorula kratochvilovae]